VTIIDDTPVKTFVVAVETVEAETVEAETVETETVEQTFWAAVNESSMTIENTTSISSIQIVEVTYASYS
jgi:hypothetical protein